ncbi:MAG: hypothetical protein HY010_01405 [Acidobacteria bacterium]|nr:hypothetical protein [Acidobacteriota bacterium]
MSRFAWYLSLLILLAYTQAAQSDDRQKAEKQVRKIAAMATDKTGRQMVSMAIADTLKLSRPQMVKERCRIGLDYGSFFVAHQLIAGGLSPIQIESDLKAGKNVWQIADERHADWKKIAENAKKQYSKVEDYIYRHFLNKKNGDADQERDLVDKYDVKHDAVRTDFDVTPKEMVEAQAQYIFWRNLAGKQQGGGSMTVAERMAAGLDHTTATHDTNGGISAPTAGGLPH